MGIIICKTHGRTGITLVSPKVRLAVDDGHALPEIEIEKDEEFGLRFVRSVGESEADEPVCSRCLEDRIRTEGDEELIERWEESKSWGLKI